MPILDLLASITGEKPTPSPNPVPRPGVVPRKRKAEDELRPAAVRAANAESMPEKASRPDPSSPRPSPRPADRPAIPTDKPASKAQHGSDKPVSTARPGLAGSNASGTGKASLNTSKSLPSRPVTSRPTVTDSAPPKKRSYAEIMARAKANSELRESLGKIHHKTVERSMTMKERKEMKTDGSKKARMAARNGTSGRARGTGMPLRDIGKASGARQNAASDPTNTQKTAPVEEKKVKKAALATTGYTGTARPRPGTSSTGKPGAAGRPGSARSRDRPRYGGSVSSSRKKYDDDDDDLDDFIEYDDEEEAGYGIGTQYRYDSYDEESDMEAGLSDIEDEEQEADRHARREDMEQEALERRLKREKEERKRRLLEAAKTKAGSR
ncbi:hypothetical protein C8A03DRAFT_31226 [Achaetomium macrosporum]|uniref:SPT2 chromatin protein n=1 Tax=Achaetomium macrosporum TaxID=79813 RepID=A0AAN7HD91_9PEZI|nr:hypothetical protein C8A03DRAFT_31226 [Achaetomium macrosporum]